MEAILKLKTQSVRLHGRRATSGMGDCSKQHLGSLSEQLRSQGHYQNLFKKKINKTKWCPKIKKMNSLQTHFQSRGRKEILPQELGSRDGTRPLQKEKVKEDIYHI